MTMVYEADEELIYSMVDGGSGERRNRYEKYTESIGLGNYLNIQNDRGVEENCGAINLGEWKECWYQIVKHVFWLYQDWKISSPREG